MRVLGQPIFCAIIAATLGCSFWFFQNESRAWQFSTSTDDHSVFFRLISRYEHAGKSLNFDIVVGCGVKVTRYGDGDRSYDAIRDPVVFGKRTSDGNVVWQIVPNACLGETTENGKVPRDFLPGAIWFDVQNGSFLGIAYVTEDAFENKRSELKFLGAEVRSATRSEWEAFQPTAKTNLVEVKAFSTGVPEPTKDELLGRLWNKEALAAWKPAVSCHAVERFEISDPVAIAMVEQYWPIGRPRFWTLPPDKMRELTERVALHNRVQVGNGSRSDYFRLGTYSARGFPTRSRGGVMYSDGGQDSEFPSEIYPVSKGDGIPWLTPSLSSAAAIYRDAALDGRANKGFAYCYSSLREPDAIRDAHMPDYRDRRFVTRVDGVPISGDDGTAGPDGIGVFFEGNRVFFVRSSFGLS